VWLDSILLKLFEREALRGKKGRREEWFKGRKGNHLKR
jgi:hypothetical protein